MIIELFKNIIMNIWTYSCYAVFGSLIYIIFSVILTQNKILVNKKYLLLVLYFVAFLIPLCNCVAISFVLYKKFYSRKICLTLFVISSFVKISSLLLIYNYFNWIGIIVYIALVILIIIVVHLMHIKTIEDSDIKRFYDDENSYKHIFQNIQKFFLTYFFGLIILSLYNYMFPNNYQLLIIENINKIKILETLNYAFSHYICIPSSIVDIVGYGFIGMNVQNMILIIFAGVLTNIQDIFVLQVYFKNIILIVLVAIFILILISLAISKIDINISNYFILQNIKMSKYNELFILTPNIIIKNITSILFMLVMSERILEKK